MAITRVPKQLITAQYIKRQSKYFLAAGLALILILVLIVVASANTERKDTALVKQLIYSDSHAVTTIGNTADAALAQQAAMAYLQANTATIPLAGGVLKDLGRHYATKNGTTIKGKPLSYTGLTLYAIKSYATAQTGKDNLTYQFLVSMNSNVYILSVPIEPLSTGPVIGNLPTLSPFIAVSGGHALDGTQYAQTAPNTGEKQQIDSWVTDYLSDNKTQLYELTGDTKPHTIFVGLSGWSLVGTPTIISSSVQNGEMLVQVNVPMAPSNDQSNISVGVYDLLLNNISHPIPNVVAWGSSSAGWTLVPFQNAIRGNLQPTTKTTKS